MSPSLICFIIAIILYVWFAIISVPANPPKSAWAWTIFGIATALFALGHILEGITFKSS